MSKIDFQQNEQVVDDFEKEQILFKNDTTVNSVPKLLTDLQQVIKDLLSKSSNLKKLTGILSQEATFQVPEFLSPFMLEDTFYTKITKKLKLLEKSVTKLYQVK